MGKPACQGGELETVWKNQLDRKKESAKSQRKAANHKSIKDKKICQKKNSNNGPKEGAVSLLEAIHKSRKAQKKLDHKEK